MTLHLLAMAPKPTSAVSKALHCCGMVPAKTTEDEKAPVDGEKKKRKKAWKVTYLSPDTGISNKAMANGSIQTRSILKKNQQVHPNTGISNKAMAILNSFERITTEASKLTAYSKKSTRC